MWSNYFDRARPAPVAHAQARLLALHAVRSLVVTLHTVPDAAERAELYGVLEQHLERACGLSWSIPDAVNVLIEAAPADMADEIAAGGFPRPVAASLERAAAFFHTQLVSPVDATTAIEAAWAQPPLDELSLKRILASL